MIDLPIPDAEIVRCPECSSSLMVAPHDGISLEHNPDGSHIVTGLRNENAYEYRTSEAMPLPFVTSWGTPDA